MQKRGKMNASLNRILLATDDSAGAELAARTAIRLADLTNSELHLVYVERLPGYPSYAPISVRHLEGELHERAEREGLERLWELDRRVRSAGGVVAGAHLRKGEVAKEVVGLAQELEVDLIILGNRGRSALRRALMGSVSDSVVRHAHCPVVVTPSQETGERKKGGYRQETSSWGTGETRSE